MIRQLVVVAVLAGCTAPPDVDEGPTPTCDEAVLAADVAMADIDPGACVDDGDCVFDGGSICGIDIAEFAYAADDSVRVKTAVQDAWADACAIGTCGLHEDTFLLAARCDGGSCRLASQFEVCAPRIDDVRAQVDAALDKRCDVADDCGFVRVEARCGPHRFQFTALGRAELQSTELVVSCDVLAAGMQLTCSEESEHAESEIACVDGACAFISE